MAPKKGSTAGRRRARGGSRASPEVFEESWDALRPSHARFPPGLVSSSSIEHLTHFVAGQGNEAGVTVLKDASTLESRLDSRDVPIFDVFILAGLVPPMSEFCHAVIATYALHLLHLHPRAIALLAIFQHFCEGFAGVIPSVTPFCHYFYPFVETEGQFRAA